MFESEFYLRIYASCHLYHLQLISFVHMFHFEWFNSFYSSDSAIESEPEVNWKWISICRTKPYQIKKFVIGFKRLFEFF